jgi:hypothetical protein
VTCAGDGFAPDSLEPESLRVTVDRLQPVVETLAERDTGRNVLDRQGLGFKPRDGFVEKCFGSGRSSWREG